MDTILVGNGPSALARRQGAKIDAFPRVMRFNRFKLAGYEPWIGSRTTLWATFEQYLLENLHWTEPFQQPETWVFTPFFPGKLDWWRETRRAHLWHVKLVTEAQAQEISRVWFKDNPEPNTWPSTGLMAIVLFKPCVIVGFDHFMAKQHHYYNSEAADGYHLQRREREIIEGFIAKGEVVRL